ncbi:transcriptional regulator [Paraburkholderia tropica]|uniref:transcriptional regulator n=1 Tax=Paraburkholderia tropica TaxID=92647 RepID=UPI002AB02386|nr:YdaS family helix-turn-helix protein [Paraburkholderia tropica]
MDLDQYLSSPGAMTISQLRMRMCELGFEVKSNAQIRQWRHGYSDRRPDTEYCVGLELATNGLVTRQELRPDDWWRKWPELPGAAERLAAHSIESSDDVQPPVGGIKRDTKMAAAQMRGVL